MEPGEPGAARRPSSPQKKPVRRPRERGEHDRTDRDCRVVTAMWAAVVWYYMAYSGGRGGASGSSPESHSPDATALFELLGDTERQVLVRHLLARSEPEVGVGELVDVFEGVFGHDRTRAVLRLRHDHLPRLAANDIVEYDREASTVRIDESSGLTDHDELRALLRQADEIASKTRGE